MRLSLATAASVGLAAALLAGCSTSSQGTSAVPGGSSQQGAAKHDAGARPAMHVSRDVAMHLQPNVLRPGTIINHMARPPHLVGPAVAPKEFIMDDGGYIWGIHGHNVVTYATDCSGAEGGVVDHTGRLVVACTNTGTVNIYNHGNYSGPANTVLDENTATSFAYPAAAFEDSTGNIYATNLYSYTNCNPSCIFNEGTIVWWTTSNQTSGATPSGSYQDPNLYEDFFADVDSSGNVYVDGYSQSFAPEVDEITGITTTPASAALAPAPALNFQGGIYVTGTGDLSIDDQGAYASGTNALTLYSLPYTGAIALGPDKSPQNISNTCDPVAGGYNHADSSILIGDAGCRAGDLGKVGPNTWHNILNINFVSPIDGAYVHSDK
jgi:hypothetical protein